MFNGYGQANTRSQGKEIVDKMALIDAMATEYASHRDFAEFVLRKVAKAPNGAVDQINCWADFLYSLPYRRESGEVLRNPNITAGVRETPVGGDCDDLTVVALAGLRVLGLPCKPEVFADSDHGGFHVRALVGLPAVKPTEWRAIDPVFWSERQWGTSNWMTSSKPLSKGITQQGVDLPDLKGLSQERSSLSKLWLIPVFLLGLLIFRKK